MSNCNVLKKKIQENIFVMLEQAQFCFKGCKQALILKENTDKLYLPQNQELYSSKDSIKRMKNRATDGEEITAGHINLSSL